VREESVPNLIQSLGLEARLTFLRNRAKQEELKLPTDVALYIAQNVRSNARALEGALARLMAHSSFTGTQITLKYTQQVLANFIAAEAQNVDVDPLQKLLSQPFGNKEAKIGRQHPTGPDRDFVFWLVKTRDGRTSRIRHELEVNMRESERERLARRDAFERELERRAAKKRRQG
jgi:chromosomal replication initiation ATPase DnaA